ncbi:MAG: dephospho-CoA kinase [Bacteroidota bacterium]|nr:dephospho-CoA kinase [Bacteroidota bacterium]
MLKIGLTGGIGSGKSTISKIFEFLDIKIYNSDIRSKILIQKDKNLVERIKKEFGESMYDENNFLNKEKLSDIVFKNEKALKKLNSITHPAVEKDFENWCKENKNQKYIIKESAILFESGIENKMDAIISVYASKEIRIERIRKRDKISREKVLEIIKNQMPDSLKMAKSNYVIITDKSQSVIKQVMLLHNTLNQLDRQ